MYWKKNRIMLHKWRHQPALRQQHPVILFRHKRQVTDEVRNNKTIRMFVFHSVMGWIKLSLAHPITELHRIFVVWKSEMHEIISYSKFNLF